jgi:hypothetical protein
MATLRLVATLALVTACYQRDPDLYMTTPEPVVVEGPPSGEIDAEWQLGYVDDNASGSVTASVEPSADPADPGYVMGTCTDGEIDATLDGYGEWVEIDGYGRVWRPYTTVVGVDFTPYETCGSWVWTDWGWTFACEWDWGWLPFHYGRWGWFDDYWGWVPDYEWTPAAVEWRGGGGYVGWRPLTPIVRDHRSKHEGIVLRDHRHEGPKVRDHRPRAKTKDWQWRFAAVDNFGKPRIRAHLFKKPAEGLRVTSIVPRPPVRPNVQPVRAASIMRARLAMASRGVRGPRATPAHGTRVPTRSGALDARRNAGARGVAPGRVTGWNRPRPSPSVYQPVYQPPAPAASPASAGNHAHAAPAGNLPEQTYGGLPVTPTTPDPTPPPSGAFAPGQQPATVYQPPGAQPPRSPSHTAPTYTPPRPPSSYQPTHQPPSHYTPPSQYTPPSRPTTYQPPRSYTPPSRPTTYQPPSHSAPPSSYSPPARSYSPPSHSAPPSSYSPPARSYSSPSRSYSPPSHSYSPPSHSSSTPSRSYSPPSHSSSSSSRSYSRPSHSSSRGSRSHR